MPSAITFDAARVAVASAAAATVVVATAATDALLIWKSMRGQCLTILPLSLCLSISVLVFI